MHEWQGVQSSVIGQWTTNMQYDQWSMHVQLIAMWYSIVSTEYTTVPFILNKTSLRSKLRFGLKNGFAIILYWFLSIVLRRTYSVSKGHTWSGGHVALFGARFATSIFLIYAPFGDILTAVIRKCSPSDQERSRGIIAENKMAAIEELCFSARFSRSVLATKAAIHYRW